MDEELQRIREKKQKELESKLHPEDPVPKGIVHTLDTTNFQVMLSSHPRLVVDFWAEWCGPCRMVAPEIKKIAERHAGRLLVVKVDTEAVPDLATRLGIMSIPTLMIFRDGIAVFGQPGALPEAALESLTDWSAEPGPEAAAPAAAWPRPAAAPAAGVAAGSLDAHQMAGPRLCRADRSRSHGIHHGPGVFLHASAQENEIAGDVHVLGRGFTR